MKRFHVNVAVDDLARSIEFYNTLFNTQPTVEKSDYARWMLEDPRINFSITHSRERRGINHVGLQVESTEAVAEIQARLDLAEEKTFQQPDTECCYARSSKTWATDPDNVRWETFVTHGELTHYGSGLGPGDRAIGATATSENPESRCCA